MGIVRSRYDGAAATVGAWEKATAQAAARPTVSRRTDLPTPLGRATSVVVMAPTIYYRKQPGNPVEWM
ncbi:hypothetical protein GCM10027289_20180 [Tsukamurella serpentis]